MPSIHRLRAAQVLEARLLQSVQAMSVFTSTPRALKRVVLGCLNLHNVIADEAGDAICGGEHFVHTPWPCEEVLFISNEFGVGVALQPLTSGEHTHTHVQRGVHNTITAPVTGAVIQAGNIGRIHRER